MIHAKQSKHSVHSVAHSSGPALGVVGSHATRPCRPFGDVRKWGAVRCVLLEFCPAQVKFKAPDAVGKANQGSPV